MKNDEREAEGIEWSALPQADGVRMGHLGARRVVEWRGVGRLWSASIGEGAEFIPHPDVDSVFLDKFRATSLVACERYLRGALSLHASAVGLEFGAVALVGDSGMGKSTMAVALVEEAGGAFLADDIVPVDWQSDLPIVSPTHDSFWLDGNTLTWLGVRDARGPRTAPHDKRAYPPKLRSSTSLRLHAIVQLSFDDANSGPTLERITGDDAFMVLSSAHVCYSLGGDEDSLRNFAARARLAARTPLFRLRRPSDFSALSACVRVLSDGVAKVARTQS